MRFVAHISALRISHYQNLVIGYALSTIRKVSSRHGWRQEKCVDVTAVLEGVAVSLLQILKTYPIRSAAPVGFRGSLAEDIHGNPLEISHGARPDITFLAFSVPPEERTRSIHMLCAFP